MADLNREELAKQLYWNDVTRKYGTDNWQGWLETADAILRNRNVVITDDFVDAVYSWLRDPKTGFGEVKILWTELKEALDSGAEWL